MTTTRLPAKESAGNLVIFKMIISVNRLIVLQSKRLSRIRSGERAAEVLWRDSIRENGSSSLPRGWFRAGRRSRG